LCFDRGEPVFLRSKHKRVKQTNNSNDADANQDQLITLFFREFIHW
jgi:hypothetical protein